MPGRERRSWEASWKRCLTEAQKHWLNRPSRLRLYLKHRHSIFFAPTQEGEELIEPLYVQTHRIRSGEQTITVAVPRQPVLAGIDPYHLLDIVELENDDNIEKARGKS